MKAGAIFMNEKAASVPQKDISNLRVSKGNPLLMHNLIVKIKNNELAMYLRGELNSEEFPPEDTYDIDEKGFAFGSQHQLASTYESQITIFRF